MQNEMVRQHTNKFVFMFILFPFYALAVCSSDIYSQQHISGCIVESGYADTLLQKNAKNVVIDITARSIIDHILDNVDTNAAKKLSVNMPADIYVCDDEYTANINGGINQDTADDMLDTCRKDLYSKNLSYIIQETATINKGAYYNVLQNIFKEHTKEFVNTERFNIDDFINKMAVYNLLSFDGKPFYNALSDIDIENIKCENNHDEINIIDDKTSKPLSEFNINGRDFYIKACLNKNKNSYFKYITLYLKNNNKYTLYERLPIFLNFYSSFDKEYDKDDIIVSYRNTKLTIKNIIYDHTLLVYDYMLYRKGTYLLDFGIEHYNDIEYIFRDTSENKYIITPNNMSLKLYRDMLINYCKDNPVICNTLHLEKILSISHEMIFTNTN